MKHLLILSIRETALKLLEKVEVAVKKLNPFCPNGPL